MSFFRKKTPAPRLTREQALACTPVRNNIVAWEVLETGAVQIEYVLVLKPFLVSIFERYIGAGQSAPTKKLLLDEFGSLVWHMLDGTRSTADIIREFAAGQGVSPQEAERSVTAFLRELGKRGLVALH